MTEPPKSNFSWSCPARRIAGIYVAVCALWILFSDRLLLSVVGDVHDLTRLQTLKGWLFVLVSAALLYVLIRNNSEAQRDALHQALSANEELTRQKELLQRLFDNIPVMVACIQGERILFLNRCLEETLGWSLGEAAERDIVAELHPDPVQRREVLEFIAAADGTWRDFKITLRDGSPLETTWANIRLSDGSVVGIGQNITARKRSEEALRESEERLNLALKAAHLGTWTWEMEDDRVIWDDLQASLFGRTREEMPSGYQEFMELIHPEDRLRFADDLHRCMEETAPMEGRFRVLWPDGSVRVLEARGKVLASYPGGKRQLTGICWDVTEKEEAERQLHESREHLHFLAHHDVLTRLPNRLLLQDRMQHALAKARRTGGQVAMIYLDLDRFKTINDSLGHAVGDRVLKEIAVRLARQVREADTVARLGGDEFVVILEQVQEGEHVAVVAQKFIHELSREILVEDHRLYVTASIGISLFPEDGFDAEGLMKSAETAMYRAKEKGKNTYQYFTSDMNTRARDLLLLESGLRQALERQQFVLFYQPQIDLGTGGLTGVEALLRWQHPERGMVAPADFIPLAEETGLIVPIGDWVLRTACTQLRQWRMRGLAPGRIAVNISPRQFRQTDLTSRVAAILAETGLHPDFLELEVTEGMIMNDVEAAIETMQELGRMGVHLAIDDFGTGYSSLGYLKRFPISGLKIDRSFVLDVTTDPSDAQIAASVIALAHSMNLRVVAEGIETQGQLAFLRQHSCDEGQGFLFSRPRSASEIETFFATRPPLS